ncbi:MAG: NAD(P)-dependent oxidoreductase [Treponema sp.]|jgi:nucleoside-diphosphate-sugar epimerase|nr:NAD(P)-dependent oxidoreductase [Treponema sp.]
MAKNILVTGGSGNLGNYVCPYLKEQGYNVASFDVNPARPDSPNAKARIPFVQGNLTSLGDCLRALAFARPDVIVHLGAIPYNTEVQPPFAGEHKAAAEGARYSQGMPEHAAMEINTMGTFYIMDAARRLGVKKVVAASSYFVLGLGFRLSGTPFVPDYLPMDEEHPLRPEDTYSLSKVLCEEIYRSFARAYGMRITAMRLLGVYYESVDWNRNSYKFNVTVPPADEINGGWLLSNVYQYVDARDIAVFVRLALEAEIPSPFEAFYVATDTTYNEPTGVVAARRWPALAEKAGNIPGTEGLISIKKAERVLGYKPAYSWRNTL